MNRISDLRKSKNLTQKELADRLNINSVTLSRYESGHRSPPIDTLKKLSEVFDGISIEYIMGETKNDKTIKVLDNIVDSLNTMQTALLKNYVSAFMELNDNGQEELFRYAKYLSSQPEYKMPEPITLKMKGQEPYSFNLDDYEVALLKKEKTNNANNKSPE